MGYKESGIALTFVNYNYAFSNFYESYKNLCLNLSEKILLNEINQVKNLIMAFIYDNEYTIRDKSRRLYYRDLLDQLNLKMQGDESIIQIINNDKAILTNRILYYTKYYEYFLSYLQILGNFVYELTSTFMPNTNIQKKIIRFSNNQIFFQKFTEHKGLISESLANFKIMEFNKTYNKLLIFYYAYHLFINDDDKKNIEKILSVLLSIYLHKDTLMILNNYNVGLSQMQQTHKIENLLHKGLLYCNSLMNLSFSNYDVLPKIRTKIYTDRTLI